MLSNPDSITEPGFYNNAFANFTTPNPELTKEIIKGGTPAATAGASKTTEEIRDAGAKAAADLGLKPFIPGVEAGSIDMEKDFYPDLYKTSATKTTTDTTAKTWDDEEWRNPVYPGFYDDRTKTSFTPTPESSVPFPGEGKGFYDPTTYNMDPDEYQDYLAEQRKGMTLVPGSGYSNLGEFQQVIDTPDGGKRIIDTRSPYDIRTPGTYDPIAQPLQPKMGYKGQIPGMARAISPIKTASSNLEAAKAKAKRDAESELDELLLMLGGEGGGPM